MNFHIYISSTRGLAVLLFFVVIGAYFSGLSGPFLFDDVPNLTVNSQLFIDGSRFDEWRTAALSSDSGLFRRPISMLSFALSHVLAGGFSPMAFKSANLLIHLIGCLVVFRLSLYIGRAIALTCPGSVTVDAQKLAFVATLFWGLHPLHVSTVLYAVQRMAQLSTLFVLLGLLVYCSTRLRWLRGAATLGEVITLVLWLAIFTILGVLSKENGIVLVLLIPALEISVFRGQLNGLVSPRFYLSAWLLLLMPAVVTAIVLVFDSSLITGGYDGREFSLEERLFTQLRVLWHYLGWLTWPDIRGMGLHHDDIVISSGLLAPLSTLLAAISWIALLLIAWVFRNRVPLLLFAVVFFLVAHSVESGLLPLEMVYEHRNYLPSVGVTIFLAFVLIWVGERLPRVRFSVVLASVIAILFLSTATRSAIWADELSLARFDVMNHAESPRSNFFYGRVLYERVLAGSPDVLEAVDRKEGILAARGYFLRMHQLSPGEFAPLVMLHQVDSTYFPGAPAGARWLPMLQDLAQNRRLQASDRTALDALVDFTLTADGSGHEEAVDAMLQTLLGRYPADIKLVMARYRILSARGASSEVLLELIEQAREERPFAIEFHFAAAKHQIPDDVGSAFEALRQGYRQDGLRRYLTSLRRIFEL